MYLRKLGLLGLSTNCWQKKCGNLIRGFKGTGDTRFIRVFLGNSVFGFFRKGMIFLMFLGYFF